MSTTVLVSAFAPFPTLTVSVSSETTLENLYDLLTDRYPSLPHHDSDSLDLLLSPHSGPIPSSDTPLSYFLSADEDDLVSLRLIPRLRGGKGGFGSQLRAAGGRMSSQKTSNNDSCRDLSGRRLSTIKEAKRLADYIESEPARKKADKEAKRAKLEALEKKVGIVPGAEASSSEPLAGKKHRLDDAEYIEQSKELVDNVKNAVSVAMLKKKKKAKLSPSAEASSSSSAKDTVAAAVVSAAKKASSTSEKILEASATGPVAVAASAAIGLVGA